MSSGILLIAGVSLAVLGALGLLFTSASAAGIVFGLLLITAYYWAKSVLSQAETRHTGLKKHLDALVEALRRLDVEESDALSTVDCKNIDEFEARDAWSRRRQT